MCVMCPLVLKRTRNFHLHFGFRRTFIFKLCYVLNGPSQSDGQKNGIVCLRKYWQMYSLERRKKKRNNVQRKRRKKNREETNEERKQITNSQTTT